MARDTLTPDKIITAAMDLLDRDGLEAFSMRTLGKQLGSAATSVYWHVGSKENLIALAADRAWHEIALPDLTIVDWRTAAMTMATDLHAMLSRHLWLVQVFGAQMVYGLGKARHDNHSLAIYEAGGFIGARADQSAATVFIFVLGSALGRSAGISLTRKLSHGGANAQEMMQESLAKAREIASQFPRLRARLESAVEDYTAAPHNSFEFGLQVILDGMEAS